MTDAGRVSAITVVAASLAAAAIAPNAAGPSLPLVRANDNRVAAGTLRRDTLKINLVVAMATWRPESDSGPKVDVAAFSEDGKAPQIPAPLIRAREGTVIVASVRNALADSTIAVIGLGTHPAASRDTLFVRPGERKEVRFDTGTPGTYLYRAVLGAHSPTDNLHEREQAAGALVVDPRGGSAPDRVFVINIWGDQTDSANYPNALAINGRSWPFTERLNAVVGDTMHWRVVNASNRDHPMHLHGAYFRVDAKGDAFRDTAYASAARRLAVTEELLAQQTMRIDWSPVRPGRWIFHCHIAFHVIPSGARLVPDDDAGHDDGSHDGMSGDPLMHMAGLVLGIDAKLPPNGKELGRGAPRRMDLYVQQGRRRGRATRAMSFVVQQGATPPAPDSVVIPGTVLVLTRNEPTDVLVHNRLNELTAVHWHGLELESFSDGVAGWSGTSAKPAHSIPPGGTFLAHLSMPRAGTFIYHTHMHDLAQLTSGLYGAIVVLEPGHRFDPRTDHVYVAGWDWEVNCCSTKAVHVLINGDSASSPPLEMRVGETHRFRFVNMGPAGPDLFRLRHDTTLVEWRAVAKDGANLPPNQATMGPAQLLIDIGETYDFEYTPTQPGELTLSAPVTPEGLKGGMWTQRIIVH